MVESVRGGQRVEESAQRFANIEVDGRNVRTVLQAFSLFPEVGAALLTKRGIDVTRADAAPTAGKPVPLDVWLDIFDEIGRRVGPAKVFEVGRRVAEFANLPPQLADFASALDLIDVAFHMNHLKDGKPMFDPKSRALTEGIGHYVVKREAHAKAATIVCDGPYPCDFDRGIFVGFGQRFGDSPRVEHTNQQCRAEGTSSCSYRVSW